MSPCLLLSLSLSPGLNHSCGRKKHLIQDFRRVFRRCKRFYQVLIIFDVFVLVAYRRVPQSNIDSTRLIQTTINRYSYSGVTMLHSARHLFYPPPKPLHPFPTKAASDMLDDYWRRYNRTRQDRGNPRTRIGRIHSPVHRCCNCQPIVGNFAPGERILYKKGRRTKDGYPPASSSARDVDQWMERGRASSRTEQKCRSKDE